MSVWLVVWIAAFLCGLGGFSYISFRVITRGIGEVKELMEVFGGNKKNQDPGDKRP